MTKTKNRILTTFCILLFAFCICAFGAVSVSAAAAADLTVEITGADGNSVSVTLKDDDGDSYYDIGTADELYAFAAAVNGGNGSINGELTKDIVVNENVLDENGELNDGSNFREWTPIGLYVDSYDAATVFHGKFNGNNHTVSGLYFNDESQNYAGLFGYTNGATINGIGVLDCYISGKQHVGGVVGFLRSGTLENCYNTGSVLGSSTNVGGVAGWAGKSSTIQNCFNTGNVSGKSEDVGGVVGYIYCVDDKTTLKNCYNTGSIVGQRLTRGVVGCLLGGTTENCFFLENTVTMNGTVGNGSGVYTGTQAMSLAQFVSGEVAYKLGSAFGQRLEGENRQSYPVLGGTPVTDSERFEIYGQQLNLGGDLSMKYYVTAYAPDFDPEQLQMQFIHNGVVSTPKYDIIDGFYVFTLNGINPQCMGDNIYAKLCYNESEVADHGYDEKYSVEINLNNLLDKYKDDAALVALINDTLAYGEAASAYKAHQTMTGTSYVENSSDRVIPESELSASGAGDLRVHQATVRYGTMNHIVMMIESKNGTPTVQVGEQSFDATLYAENSNYYVSVLHGVSATDFGNDITVSISDGNTIIDYTVSINDYLYVISQSTNAGENMKALTKALYNYGYSAKVYEHIVKGDEHTTVNGICTLCNENVGYDVDEKTDTYSVYEAEALQSVLEEAALCEGTVKLMRDLTVDADSYYSLLISSGTVILDLNGYKLTSADEVAILVAEGASLTVRDSDHTGSINAMTTGLKTTGIKNQGALYVESGIILANTFGIYNDNILTISGGTVGAKEHVAILGGEVNLIGAPVLVNGSVTTGRGCDIACSVILVQGDQGDARYTYYDSEVSGNYAPQCFVEFTGYTLNTDRTYFDKVN